MRSTVGISGLQAGEDVKMTEACTLNRPGFRGGRFI